MDFRRICSIHCVLLVFLATTISLSAQGVRASGRNDHLEDRYLENVRIKAQSIGQLFSSLSLTYDIPIGLEIAVNDNELNDYDIDFNKGSISDLLTQFVEQHEQYAWQINDGVINVFPKDKFRDEVLDQLLGAEISRFSVKENSGCWAVEDSLATTPEINRIAEANYLTYRKGSPNGFYIPQLGKRFKLEVSNMTLRSILNKVIKESPVARVWLVKRYEDDQTFFIRLNARLERD